MIIVLLAALLAAAVFVAMEGAAWLLHRYVMHGLLWSVHRTHHEPRHGPFELNDLFAIAFAAPAIGCFWFGRHSPWALAVAVGITAYGIVYGLFHDGWVHRRFPMPKVPMEGFWRARLQAHRLHHAVSTRTGCVSYGFLWAPPVRALKAQLVTLRRAPPADLEAP